MYYKVIKNDEVVDVLNHILYIIYQEKHSLLLLCDITEAQAILSSDGKYGWHIEGLYNFPPDNDIYAIKEISKCEQSECAWWLMSQKRCSINAPLPRLRISCGPRLSRSMSLINTLRRVPGE